MMTYESENRRMERIIGERDAEIERLKKICKENDYGSRLDESKTISGKTSTRCRQTLGRKP